MDLEVDARSDVTGGCGKVTFRAGTAKGECPSYWMILKLTLLVSVPLGVVATTLAGCSAARDDCCRVGVGDDLETGRRDSVEGDAGCSSQALAENPGGLAHLCATPTH